MDAMEQDHARGNRMTQLTRHFYFFCFKPNHSAKREEAVDSNLAAVGTCDHINTDVE